MVKESTFQMLKRMKEQDKAVSYDAVIESLLKQKMDVNNSMFGVLKDRKLKYDKKKGGQSYSHW